MLRLYVCISDATDPAPPLSRMHTIIQKFAKIFKIFREIYLALAPEVRIYERKQESKRKKENTLSTKKPTKKRKIFFSWLLYWSRACFLSFFLIEIVFSFFFSFFFGHFLGRKRVFLFSFINSRLSAQERRREMDREIYLKSIT